MKNKNRFKLFGEQLLFKLTKKMETRDVVNLLTTNRSLYTFYKSQDFWSRRFHEINRESFLRTYKDASHVPMIQQGLRNNIIFSNDIPNIARYLDANLRSQPSPYTDMQVFEMGRSQFLYQLFNHLAKGSIADLVKEKTVNPEQVLKIPKDYLNKLASPNCNLNTGQTNYYGLDALRRKLITLEQAALMPNTYYFSRLLCPNGLIALERKLITPEQIAKMPNELYINALLTENGLMALEEKLITLEEVAALPSNPHVKQINFYEGLGWCDTQDASHLRALLTDEGILALRYQLITPAQAGQLPEPAHLCWLITVNGRAALREKLVTPEQIARFEYADYVKHLLSNNGLTALRGKLITCEQAQLMPFARHLECLLKDNGLIALSDKLITPEEAAQIKYGEDLDSLLSDAGIDALRHDRITLKEAIESDDVAKLIENANTRHRLRPW